MIKKGDKFRCIKTLIHANSDLWYHKGKIYTSDMDGYILFPTFQINEEGMVVKKGRRYKCIKTVYMNDDRKLGDLRYIEGKIYKSEIEGCITDETGLKEHIWMGSGIVLEETFTQVSNKRKRYGDCRTE